MQSENKTDVLFVYTNILGAHSDVYSFGIGCLSSVLKKEGFRTRLIVIRQKGDFKTLFKAVQEYKPRVIGFSSVSSQFIFVSYLAKKIRKWYKGIIVCGGVHPTIFPECLFSAPCLDGVFIGESELAFMEFVSSVIKGDNYKYTDNFCFTNNGKLVKNKLKPRIQNLQTLPFPDREIYDYQKVIDENNGEAVIMTSRGCPFSCSYCSNHAIARVYGERQNAIRHNSVEKSLDEICMLKSRYKFEKLYFSDDLFTLNNEWLERFLHEYKKIFSIPFMCQIRPNACNRDLIFKLKDAGCYRIFIAVESANDHIRNKVMGRNITKVQLENSFYWAKEAGIETLSVNIIGVPGETKESILETINFNRAMNPTITGVNIFSPYEGTELGDYCREQGLLRKKNMNKFSDRRESRLRLSTISNTGLMKLYERFEYLVYKDTDPKKARNILLKKYYKKLEGNLLFGFIFRCAKKTLKIIGYLK